MVGGTENKSKEEVSPKTNSEVKDDVGSDSGSEELKEREKESIGETLQSTQPMGERGRRRVGWRDVVEVLAVALVVLGVLLLVLAVFYPEKAVELARITGKITGFAENPWDKYRRVYEGFYAGGLSVEIPEPPRELVVKTLVGRAMSFKEFWSLVGDWRNTQGINTWMLKRIYNPGIMGDPEKPDCKTFYGSLLCFTNPLELQRLQTAMSGKPTTIWASEWVARESKGMSGTIVVWLVEVPLDEEKPPRITVYYFKPRTPEDTRKVAWWIRNISVTRSPVIVQLTPYDPRFGYGKWLPLVLPAYEDAVRWLKKHGYSPLLVIADLPVITWCRGDPKCKEHTQYWDKLVDKPFVDTLAREIVVHSKWDILYPSEAFTSTILLYKGCAVGHLNVGQWGVPPYAWYLGSTWFADVILPRVNWSWLYETVCVDRMLVISFGAMPRVVFNASIEPYIEYWDVFDLPRPEKAYNVFMEWEPYSVWMYRWHEDNEPSMIWFLRKYLDYREKLYGDSGKQLVLQEKLAYYQRLAEQGQLPGTRNDDIQEILERLQKRRSN